MVAYALSEAATWVETSLRAGRTLYTSAAQVEGWKALSGGRAMVRSFPSPNGDSRWVVRHYQRGGAVGPYLGDRYLRVGRMRARSELEASERLRSKGLKTPKVVAAAHYPSGAFYRADLVTQWVPGSTLIDVVRALENSGVSPREALGGAASAIQTLAALGALHVDLNANNLLLEENNPEAPWILDLDRVRFGVSHDSATSAMTARLLRSLAKLEVGSATLEIAEAVLLR